MTDVLKVKHKESEVRPGTWVRIKRGKYAMDLAQVHFEDYRGLDLRTVIAKDRVGSGRGLTYTNSWTIAMI